ncbi:hypothetical protein BDR03DRAFT_813490, partial [Suillus americanus]
PLHPPFMAARFCHVITMRGQKAIVKAWDAIKLLGVQCVKHHTSRSEANRSSTPAYHFGVWQVQQPCPVITRETRLQKPAGLKAIDSLMSAAQRYVAPKVSALLWRYAPKQLERQRRAYRLIKYRILKDEFLARPTLDFFGAFFTFAIKEGTREIFHIDWNDELDSITWLIALGDWEGGEL